MNPSSLSPVPPEYRETIFALRQALHRELFLTGGWALSALLKKSYVGDVDVITTATKKEIAAASKSLHLSCSQSSRGGLRILLNDRNHMDVSSTHSFSESKTISDALQRFSFSANSIAINVNSGDLVRTSDNVIDLARNSFRLNREYVFECRDTVSNLIKLDTLQHFFRLTPKRDCRTISQIRLRTEMRNRWKDHDPQSNLISFSRKISRFVPPNTQAWFTRGIVRAALTRSLTFWDDLDIMVDCSEKELLKFLDRNQVVYTLNYFNLPKVHLPDGQKLDMIPVNGIGDVERLLRSFPIRADSVAWSITARAFVDPIGAVEDISDRRLKLCDDFWQLTSESDRRFVALKSVFVLTRHKMRPDDEVRDLINVRQNYTLFDRRNATRLAAELSPNYSARGRLQRYVQRWRPDRYSALAMFAECLRD